jgi:integrase
MASVFIVKRASKKGTRFHVRLEYGRSGPQVHLGVYPNETLAKARRKRAWEELAAGIPPEKNPTDHHKATIRLHEACDRWLASRIDVAEKTRSHFAGSVATIKARFGDRNPASITVEEIQQWINDQTAAGYAPGTVRLRLTCLGMVLRKAKVRPNPVRDEELRKPRSRRSRFRLPTPDDLVAIYAKLPEHFAEPIQLMEHAGLRVGEAAAVRWCDWDRPRKRLLVPDAKTEAGTRWIKQLEGLPEMPEKPEGVSDEARVFRVGSKQIQNAMRKACLDAGIRNYSPHDLRHLHASRLLHHGKLSPAEIAARLGHASPQMTLSTYSHVVLPD